LESRYCEGEHSLGGEEVQELSTGRQFEPNRNWKDLTPVEVEVDGQMRLKVI
jgi:hypothetical protein